MEWLNSLFFEHTPLQAVVILSIITAVGLGLGKIHVFGISLGVTFVFFAGILAGHLGFSIDSNMLNYAESFGLVLFVYELGLQVGPGFFSSFRKGGVKLNMLGMGVVLIGTVMTVILSKLTTIPMSDMVGILCGATTNTPALGAAQQTLKTTWRTGQWSSVELRGDLSAGSSRCHPCHAGGSQAFCTPIGYRNKRARRCQPDFHCYF